MLVSFVNGEIIQIFQHCIFQEDLSEAVIQGDALPGHVGSACLLSSTIAELGKSCGIITLPIMNRISRKTIGKVRGMLDAEIVLM